MNKKKVIAQKYTYIFSIYYVKFRLRVTKLNYRSKVFLNNNNIYMLNVIYIFLSREIQVKIIFIFFFFKHSTMNKNNREVFRFENDIREAASVVGNCRITRGVEKI